MQVTQILSQIESGDAEAADALLPLVYRELRQLAARRLRQEAPGQTLEPTALVHEAFLRLVGGSHPWTGRAHFFGAAAEAMRRILIERARRRGRKKHGGGRQRIEVDPGQLLAPGRSWDLLALDEALTRLADEQPSKAELVKLRFFAGMTMPEAASALGISLATAERHWAFAKAWLYAEMAEPS